MDSGMVLQLHSLAFPSGSSLYQTHCLTSKSVCLSEALPLPTKSRGVVCQSAPPRSQLWHTGCFS